MASAGLPVDLSAPERSGFSARIRRSITETPFILNVQRELFLGWVGLCVFLVLILPWPAWIFSRLGVVACLWASGVGMMAYLTRKDPQWPELVWELLWDLASALWHRRPRDVFDA